MAFMYDSNLSTDKDLIRFKLGDTVDNLHYLEDEEILSMLVANKFSTALIECCEAIVAKLAKRVTYKIGPESVNLSEAHDHYASLLIKLQAKYSKSLGVPSSNIVAPQFKIGMHDYVRTT